VESEYGDINTMSPTTTLNDEDGEDGEEWRFDPDTVTVSSSKNLDSNLSPTGTENMTHAPDVTKDTASDVVHAVNKYSGAFITMMTEGEWPGQTPAQYIAMVQSYATV
jgi:hypothetical protein